MYVLEFPQRRFTGVSSWCCIAFSGSLYTNRSLTNTEVIAEQSTFYSQLVYLQLLTRSSFLFDCTNVDSSPVPVSLGG